MSVTIEALEPHHWLEVRRIYAEGLATRNASFETTVPDWPAFDAAHLAIGRLVAVVSAAVRAWVALSPVSSRAVYAGVAAVSIYVDPEVRGRGIGHLLLGQAIRCSEEGGLWMLQASIFPENTASLRLHEKSGFRVVGFRERIARHHGVWRNTVLLERRSRTVGTELVSGTDGAAARGA